MESVARAAQRGVMHNKTNIIRWILVIPSAFVGWYVAVYIGLVFYSLVDSFCPPELIESGICVAPWSKPVKDGIIVFGACLSAVLVLLFSVFIAPTKRLLAAKVIYFGGVLFALYAVYETSAWGAFIGSIISGTLFLILILRYLKGKKSA